MTGFPSCHYSSPPSSTSSSSFKLSMYPDADADAASGVHTVLFHNAIHFLDALEPHLARRPRESNIIYAHAFKLREQLRSSKSIAPNQFWIACYSRANREEGESGKEKGTGSATQNVTLDFVLSCTEGYLGTYPIFIYCTRPTVECTRAFLEPRLTALAEKLYDTVPASRVFSVFALAPVTQCFAKIWKTMTGNAYGDPLYSATSSYCTTRTFRGAQTISEPHHSMRRATLDDLEQCAALCQEFAATSPPFTLTASQARKEAETLIRNRQLWVYELPKAASSSTSSDKTSCSPPLPTSKVDRSSMAISTIVAVTRTTPMVSAITKVYTTDRFRRRGCADRLVAHVTDELLQKDPVRSVVLFVGHTLDAVRVYDRVGFVGLDGTSKVDSVEDWLELGFERTDLGHW